MMLLYIIFIIVFYLSIYISNRDKERIRDTPETIFLEILFHPLFFYPITSLVFLAFASFLWQSRRVIWEGLKGGAVDILALLAGAAIPLILFGAWLIARN